MAGLIATPDELFQRALASFGPVRDLELAWEIWTRDKPAPYSEQDVAKIVRYATRVDARNESKRCYTDAYSEPP